MFECYVYVLIMWGSALAATRNSNSNFANPWNFFHFVFWCYTVQNLRESIQLRFFSNEGDAFLSKNSYSNRLKPNLHWKWTHTLIQPLKRTPIAPTMKVRSYRPLDSVQEAHHARLSIIITSLAILKCFRDPTVEDSNPHTLHIVSMMRILWHPQCHQHLNQ